jgi:hypothetical protein
MDFAELRILKDLVICVQRQLSGWNREDLPAKEEQRGGIA